MSSGFRERMRDNHDRQRARRDEQEVARREAQLAREEERLRERQELWQRALDGRIAATQQRLDALRARAAAAPPARGAARERILAEATALFLARGFADVAMQEIADAVGVTKAAMYYHFRSKEELFEAVAERAINDFWGGLIAAAGEPGPLREVLRAIVAYVEAAFETVSLTLIEDIGRHLSPEAQNRIMTEHPTPGRELQALFDGAIAAGEMRPLDSAAVAEMFLAMLLSLTHRGHSQRRPQPGDDDLLLDVLLHGIASHDGPRP